MEHRCAEKRQARGNGRRGLHSWSLARQTRVQVRSGSAWSGSASVLQQEDPEVAQLVCQEEERQRKSLTLIASENFAPSSVLSALSSATANKYSEGHVGKRYYGGTTHIDQIESLCQRRALDAFSLKPDGAPDGSISP